MSSLLSSVNFTTMHLDIENAIIAAQDAIKQVVENMRKDAHAIFC